MSLGPHILQIGQSILLAIPGKDQEGATGI